MMEARNYSEESRENILLVEDEPTNMAILSAYLQNAGYNVREAMDGDQAWNILLQSPHFDLIVTDRRMPNMDGLDFMKMVRQNKNLSHISVIMQTSAASQSEIAEGIKAGAYYYLTKPYEESTLLAIVRSAMYKQKETSLFEQKVSRQHNALGNFMNGEFEIKTPEQGQNVALLLADAFPRAELAVTGLYELILNAIEHGNLGIGYARKNALLKEGLYEQELKNELQTPDNAHKTVWICYEKGDDRIEVTVKDQGQGFDWQPFLEIEPSRATQGSGRGIAKANLISFDSLEYANDGNTVKAITFLRR